MDKLFHTDNDLLPSAEDGISNLELKKQRKFYLFENIGIGKSFHLFAFYHRLRAKKRSSNPFLAMILVLI